MKKIIIYTAFIVSLLACRDGALTGDSIIIDDTTPQTEVDKWISSNVTNPYNIEVVYRWTDGETDLEKNLAPPEEDKVVGFMEVLKTLWIDTYVEQAGADFLKELSPKQILLIGSQNFNSDGSVTEGTAEGGRKIILYDVNGFDSHDASEVRSMIHVVHHEFAHIMHQTKDYSTDYDEITPEGYTTTWYNVEDSIAKQSGFITPYAMLNTDEDFVEMVATFITNSNAEWEAILSGISNPEGVASLRKKEAIVADYFMTSWGIDIYDFQKLVSDEINRIVNE